MRTVGPAVLQVIFLTEISSQSPSYLEDHFITSPTFTPEILGVDSDQLLSSLNMALNAVFKLVKMVFYKIK